MKKILLLALMGIFILFSSQVFAANTISGTIYFASSQPNNGNLVIIYTPATGPGPSCTAIDWWDNQTRVDQGPVSFPYSYTLTVPASGFYCLAAYVDDPPTGYPPNTTDPGGVYSAAPGQLTAVSTGASGVNMTLYDLGSLSGNWDLTVTVDVLGVNGPVDCTYTGSVSTYSLDPNALVFGGGPITASSGTLCPEFLDMFFFCDVSTNPITCSLAGAPPPDTPYTSQGNISNNGNRITGSFNGSVIVPGAGTINYTADWTLNRVQTSIPTMTEWGAIIFIVLAGFGAVYFIRKRRRLES